MSIKETSGPIADQSLNSLSGPVAEKPEGQQEAPNIEKDDQKTTGVTMSSQKKITQNGKTYQVSVQQEKPNDAGSTGGSVEQTSTGKSRKKRLQFFFWTAF